jgi:hypothetical protein
MAAMRRGIGIVMVVVAARVAAGCGQLLAEPADSTPDAASSETSADARSSDSGDGTAQPKGDSDVARDAAVDSCRDLFASSFEMPGCDPVAEGWSSRNVALSDASIQCEGPGHEGNNGLSFKVTSSSSGAFLAKSLSGTCGVTVDFWIKRVAGAGGPLHVLQLTAANRIRFLILQGAEVALEGEGARRAPLSSVFTDGAYHHVVVRYEPSGEMSVTIGARSVDLPGAIDASLAPPTEVRIGLLGAEQGNGKVVFDDVRIY